ncbi:MAG: hypothetical protein ACC700_15415 [Anaerolineales bacterium]
MSSSKKESVNLYGKFKRLLIEVSPLLEFVDTTAQKWVEVSEGHRELRTVRDKTGAVSSSYFGAFDQIQKLDSYLFCKKAFEEDSTFEFAGFLAGYWGSFDAILQDVIISSGRLSANKVSIDYRRAYGRFRELRRDFGLSRFRYQARVRLYGVRLRPKRLSLSQDILLYRLSRKERNDRQYIVQPYVPSGFQDPWMTYQPTEVRVPIEVQVNRLDENAYFRAHNSAQATARRVFRNLANAIRLVKPGKIALGPIELLGGFSQMGVGQSLEGGIPPHPRISVATSDREDISKAYGLVSGGEGSDPVLSRSLHRFLLGRTRQSVEDRIVDYVIGWEILLLTAGGSAQKQELSYRFSVNGVSVAFAISSNLDRQRIFNKMRSAYSARSALLHGSTEDSLTKALTQGQFESASELAEFLEHSYREAIFWLASIPEDRRPYLRGDGWHRLLWPN